MRTTVAILVVVGMSATLAPAAMTPWVEDFNVTDPEAGWFPGTEDPVDPGLNGYWDVERVSVPTGAGDTGWYYPGKIGDNGHNTPDGSWSMYNNANGFSDDYSNARHLLWIEETFDQADVAAFEFDYKSRRSNLTDIHVAARVAGQMYITTQVVTDLRGDRDLEYLQAVMPMEELTWVPIEVERLDTNVDTGQNANAYGYADGQSALDTQNKPDNLAPYFGVLPDELPAGPIEAVGIYVASGTHVDGEYVQDTRGTVYVDNFAVVPEPMSMALLSLGGLGVLLRRRG